MIQLIISTSRVMYPNSTMNWAKNFFLAARQRLNREKEYAFINIFFWENHQKPMNKSFVVFDSMPRQSIYSIVIHPILNSLKNNPCINICWWAFYLRFICCDYWVNPERYQFCPWKVNFCIEPQHYRTLTRSPSLLRRHFLFLIFRATHTTKNRTKNVENVAVSIVCVCHQPSHCHSGYFCCLVHCNLIKLINLEARGK